MPSIFQHSNGSNALTLQQSNGNLKVDRNENVDSPKLNGHTNGHQDHDAFQHLPKPQQDVLLLHGPRQKYSLHSTGEIPELRAEREILIQVVEV